jgi:wyosine [tRNA(Phe)-imidazoG37] synthetase (radical SAM superfamily)
MSVVFGPVPSRRLGRSLGICSIPPKVCSHACVYCQAGPTLELTVERRRFLAPERIRDEVAKRLELLAAKGQSLPDFVSFVPDGEPTLDRDLGRAIELLRPLGIQIAVISNASLLWSDEVRADLSAADWVSLKLDSVNERTWRRIDRPHRSLGLPAVLEGMLRFREAFSGKLVTATMLGAGTNDDARGLAQLAEFVARLRPATAYLSVPTRPPARRGITAPAAAGVLYAYQLFVQSWPEVELLTGYEGSGFGGSGDAEEDLLGITAVHPMRSQAVEEQLARSGADRSLVERLVEENLLVRAEHGGQIYYLRRFSRPGRAGKRQSER